MLVKIGALPRDPGERAAPAAPDRINCNPQTWAFAIQKIIHEADSISAADFRRFSMIGDATNGPAIAYIHGRDPQIEPLSNGAVLLAYRAQADRAP
jgi:hypothetical protein